MVPLPVHFEGVSGRHIFATLWAVEAAGVEVLRLDVYLDTVDVFGGVVTVRAGATTIGQPLQLGHHQTLYHIPSYAQAS